MRSKAMPRASWGTLSAIRRGPRWPLLLWLAVVALLLGPPLRTVSSQPRGQQVTAPPPLLLANVYRQVDLSEYWVSEKLDGVRAYWNGERLISRGGNAINAPGWFSDGFPATTLDGELWMGRGTFEALSAAVRRRQPVVAEWRKIRFMVFDLPDSESSFDDRLTELRQLVATTENLYLVAVKQAKIATHDALQEKLRTVVAGGGEGLMLHRGSSIYRAGRSNDLLKLKPYQDAEARVIAHLPGKGKYQGMLGALLVESADGRRFRLGTGFSEAQRGDPPPVGALVTYRHRGLTRTGLPRFASFVRVRQSAMP